MPARADSLRGEGDWVGWELFGNRAVRQGDWKILNSLRAVGGTGDWQLFNLRNDPGETRDLAKENPDKLKELIVLWDHYVKQNGVILTGDGPYKKGKERLVEDDLYQ